MAAIIAFRPLKILLALILLGIYVKYFQSTVSDCGEVGSCPKPLHFQRQALPPRWRFISFQVIVSLAIIIYGADLFIAQVNAISQQLSVSALVLSLLITPIATELPEKFNSLIWVRNEKDTLAMGNITGAMVFQSCILPAFGIFFTPWHLSEPAIVAASLGIISSIAMLITLKLRKKLHAANLIAGGVFYGGFIAYVFVLNRIGAGFVSKAILSILSLR
jgi:cation:H+ antiporter